ncbi:MAG TPA: phosphatase PAP2 family protein [Ktedonobacterales bacterium]|nr:phosphatase PAP2 family protein [Ktedonobacterales bacterium]
MLTPFNAALRSRRARLLAIPLWATGLVALIVLSVLAHSNAQYPGDAAITGLLRPLGHSSFARVIEFPSDVNQPTLGAILVGVIVAILAVLRHFRAAIAVAVGTLVADLINAVINGLVARPRPNHVHVPTISGLGAHSFPSGHVEHVTVLFGFLFYLTVLAVHARPDRRVWLLLIQIICVYFIALIGVGRIVAGDHQPSDVLAGYLVAALLLPLVCMFYRCLDVVWRRHRRRKVVRLVTP